MDAFRQGRRVIKLDVRAEATRGPPECMRDANATRVRAPLTRAGRGVESKTVQERRPQPGDDVSASTLVLAWNTQLSKGATVTTRLGRADMTQSLIELIHIV